MVLYLGQSAVHHLLPCGWNHLYSIAKCLGKCVICQVTYFNTLIYFTGNVSGICLLSAEM